MSEEYPPGHGYNKNQSFRDVFGMKSDSGKIILMPRNIPTGVVLRGRTQVGPTDQWCTPPRERKKLVGPTTATGQVVRTGCALHARTHAAHAQAVPAGPVWASGAHHHLPRGPVVHTTGLAKWWAPPRAAHRWCCGHGIFSLLTPQWSFGKYMHMSTEL
ncbi:hypothetical protein Taro_002599 [Colocasia esculenta]|uniref:Uncharacterized protein n=1 Tax=Colocasia esculenta TaxID=4460 RepID=A0A843TJL3_COLES|nr:hypothetical protein [Colocasia esculenta]